MGRDAIPPTELRERIAKHAAHVRCSNLSRFMTWDGVHLLEVARRGYSTEQVAFSDKSRSYSTHAFQGAA